MVDVVTEIVIDRSPPVVSEYAGNPDNAPRWYVNIKSAESRFEGPLQVGSQIAFHARFLGRDLEYVYEIIELVQGTKMVMKTADGPFPMETTYTWEPVGADQTRMTLRNRGMPSGFSRWMTPLMVPMMRRANKKDLLLLKQILESGQIGKSDGD